MTRSTSDPSLLTMDHAMGFAGGSIIAVVMKCEGGHERSRSLPYGKEIRLGDKGCGRSNRGVARKFGAAL